MANRRAGDLKLAQHWDAQAEEWARWAGASRSDSYWRFHGQVFHELVGSSGPPERALDLACGEGRVARRLAADGWTVDASDIGLRLCRFAAASGLPRVVCASASEIPAASGSYQLVSIFMALHDIDEALFEGVLDETVRVLRPGGSLVAAVNHPVHSMLASVPSPDTEASTRSGNFAHLSVRHSYFEPNTYSNLMTRDGATVQFSGVQRPLERYVNGYLDRGLVLRRMVEVGTPANSDGWVVKTDWSKVPLFVDLRFEKPKG